VQQKCPFSRISDKLFVLSYYFDFSPILVPQLEAKANFQCRNFRDDDGGGSGAIAGEQPNAGYTEWILSKR
jgi:hypothetical protein